MIRVQTNSTFKKKRFVSGGSSLLCEIAHRAKLVDSACTWPRSLLNPTSLEDELMESLKDLVITQ